MSNFIEGPVAYSKEWYALRVYNPKRTKNPVVFGASESAPCCGLSRYQTPLELYYRKRGEIKPLEETDAMRLGKLLEPVVIGEFERRMGWICDRDVPMLLSKQYPYVGATPDAWVIVDGDRRTMDAKTTSFRRAEEFGEEWTDELPDDILLQVQQQLFVSGCRIGYVAVLLDGRTLRCYTVEANETLQGIIVDAETEMLERIKNSDPPEPTWRHSSTNALLKEIYGINKDREVILSDEAALFYEQYQQLGQIIKEQEQSREECMNHVLHSLGEAGVGLLPDGSSLARVLINVKARSQDAYSYTRITKRKPKE